MSNKKENEIVKTMESVIESVKKKHKRKKYHHHHNHHRHHNHHHHNRTHNGGNRDNHHHDQNENSEPELSDILVISNAISKNLSIISPNQSTEIENNENNSQNITQIQAIETKTKKKTITTIKSLRNSCKERKITLKNEEVINITKSTTDSYMKNMKKNSEKCSNVPVGIAELSPINAINKVNAFDIMMNAHNRSIEMNLSGKAENDDDDDLNENSLENTSSKKQRRKILEEWANKKGGLKRKLQEEARENYIEFEMRKRAKRLKSMILNGASSIIEHRQKSEENMNTLDSESSKKNRKSKRNKSSRDKTLIIDEKIEISNSTPKIAKRRKVFEIDELNEIDSTDEGLKIIRKSEKSVNEEFVGKLSSPIKKRDSLFGYFPKIVSPISFDITEQTVTKSDSTKRNILNSSEDFESNLHKISKTKSSDNKNNSKVKAFEENLSLNCSSTDIKKSIKPTRKSRKSKKNDDKNLDEELQKNKQNKLETECLNDETHVNDKINNKIKESSTLNGRRPRRSCVSNVRYNYDSDLSPIKKSSENQSQNKTNNKINNNSKNIIIKNDNHDRGIQTSIAKDEIQNDSSIILVDDFDNENVNVNILSIEINEDNDNSLSFREKIPSKKLAPIFIKSVPKPNIDADILLAKHKFLMSGVPEKMKLELEKQKQFEMNYEMISEEFPITDHILQYQNENRNSNKIDDWNKFDIKWKLNEDDDPDHINSSTLTMNDKELIKNKSYKLVMKYENEKCIPSLQKLKKIDNKQLIIKNLKIIYDKFPTYRCYNQLREKYRYFSAIDTNLEMHHITDSLVVTKILKKTRTTMTKYEEQDYDDQIPPSIAPNGELLFTEKYKPLLTEQVLVNFNPVNKLKEFLSLWQNRKNLNSSMIGTDDFECTNDSTSSNNLNNLMNTVVLIGPCSSGKTNAVFTVANELNFNVLEINAGMKRTGKKILQELQEATQSHQVGKDGNHLLGSKNGKIVDRKKKSLVREIPSPSSENNNQNTNSIINEKLSLILIEDADIIFEQDNGFIDAIQQLSSISKRPVIITANTHNKCQHLLKFINQNSIQFSSPNILNISKYLSIISLIENCLIDLDDIISLYLYNNKNLRKTLLEMQFFIQSGGDRDRLTTNHNNYVDNKNNENNYIVHRTLFDFYTTNQNYNLRIPLPINLNLLWSNLKDIFHVSKNLYCYQKHSNTNSTNNQLANKYKNKKDEDNHDTKILAEFYENISVATNLLSVHECNNLGEYQNYLSEDITHNLIELSIDNNLNADKVPYNLFESHQEKLHLTSYISSNTMTTRTFRSVNLDYESCLRSMCRSERLRLLSERRSKSRFYHYLRNICTSDLSSFSSNLFEKSCEIFSSSS